MNKDIFQGWDTVRASDITREQMDRDFRRVMSKAESLQAPRKFFRSQAGVRYFFAAALALLLLVGAVAVFRFASVRPQQVIVAENIEYTAPKGEIREIVLPDESKVTLNSGSVLICPSEFGATRSVYLLGEAIFDVTASDSQPFMVSTSDLRLRVHGTRFNVRAYIDDPDVRTTLCRGAVEVWPADRSDRRIELEPGQTLTYDKSGGSMIVTRSNTSEATSWESGELYFRSESIHGVVRILERQFNVNVYLTTDKYDDAVITASFIHGESLEDLLKAITAVIPGMKYSINGNKVYLK